MRYSWIFQPQGLCSCHGVRGVAWALPGAWRSPSSKHKAMNEQARKMITEPLNDISLIVLKSLKPVLFLKQPPRVSPSTKCTGLLRWGPLLPFTGAGPDVGGSASSLHSPWGPSLLPPQMGPSASISTACVLKYYLGSWATVLRSTRAPGLLHKVTAWCHQCQLISCWLPI